MHCEHLKHTGEYPIVGVNTFRNPHGDPIPEKLELARSTEEEKRSKLERLRAFHERHAAHAPAMLNRLRDVVIADGNVFEALMDAVRVCSLGQITGALSEVGAVPAQHGSVAAAAGSGRRPGGSAPRAAVAGRRSAGHRG